MGSEIEKLLICEVRELRADVKKILQDVSALKVKAGIWGLLGGAISAGMAFIVYLIQGK